MSLERLNTMPEPAARELLTGCLDVPRWVDTVLDGRPYADAAALQTVAEVAASTMSEQELAQALSRHPRIGERAAGSSSDARHSEAEQGGVDATDDQLAHRLAEGNHAYEQRFDRVFLIRAAGRDGEQILAELDRRLGNDDETERAETITQLRGIALLRLEQVVGRWPR